MFRMLEPAEISAAMDFPRDYQMVGTRRERVRLAGNAVTPPAARDLIGLVVEALTGQNISMKVALTQLVCSFEELLHHRVG